MKICFICSEYPPALNGGIGTFVKELAEMLVLKGNEVRVIGLYSGTTSREVVNGVHIYRIRKTQKRFFWIADLLRIRKIIGEWVKKSEVEIIEDNDWDSYSSFFFGLRVPVVLRIHSRHLSVMESLNELNLAKRLKFKGALKRSTSVVAVSKNTLDCLKKLVSINQDATYIYNGVKVNDLCYSVEHRIENKVMFAGTLVEEKGIVNLIKAWKKIKQILPKAELYVFGKDKNFQNGRSITAHLKQILGEYQDSVKFKGHVSKDELNMHFKNSMLFISPSFFEAFSLAPLEAMAYGCPTIFTKLSSGPEAINSGVEGLLIDPRNPDEIAQAIVSLLQDAETCEKYSLQGYDKVCREFNVVETAQKNLEYYNKLIRN